MILLLLCPYALPALRDLIIPLVCSVVEVSGGGALVTHG